MSSPQDIVIVAAARTPIGKFGGTLSKTPASELGAIVIQELLRRSGLQGEQINEVILGQVLTAGVGQNPARQAVIKAGLPGSRDGQRMGDWKLVDTMIVDGLWDVYNQYHMGITAENVAKEYHVSRAQQDELALASQQKAAAAQDAGRFTAEIVPVTIPQKKGDPVVFAADEFINRKSTAEALAGLKPAFDKAGSVTAGNASGLNDGAAGLVLMTDAKAKALGLTPLARIASYASAGVDPKTMGMGPVPASRKALERAGWQAKDLDLLEINEAFAAQACAVHQEMGWDLSKVNVNGGAIALGHPIGASGARILVTLLHEMIKRDARKGIASLCIGGGMGVALCVER